MARKDNIFEDRRPLINIKFPPVPSTTSVLAFGFLIGCLLFTPMIAVVGRYILPDYREAVMTIVGLFKDGMLLILGFYFAKVVNAGQQDMANKALDVARESAPAYSPAPADARAAAEQVADAADEEARAIAGEQK
jgi:hypothetical protein